MSHDKAILSLCFSDDSRLLASSDDHGTIKIWKYNKGKCLKTFKAPINHIGSLVFSSDNSTFYAASFCGTIFVYSLQTENLLQSIISDHPISQMSLL